MAFKGKLAGVSGRKLFFGAKDDKGRYEREFRLANSGKVLRSKWPDWQPARLSDLKNGMTVRCCGVEAGATEGELHSVCIESS